MISLIYASSATRKLTNEELLDILESSHRNNAKHDITGILLYKDGNFMQVLEGDEEKVMQVYATIEQDPRHHQVMLISTRRIKARQFENWEMGFFNLDDADLRQIPGYSEFMNTPLNADKFFDQPGFAHRFLEVFKEVTN